MRKESVKRYYANGIEIKDEKRDSSHAIYLLRENREDIYDAISKQKKEYGIYPIKNLQDLRHLRANKQVVKISDKDISVFIEETESLDLLGNQNRRAFLEISYLRRTKI